MSVADGAEPPATESTPSVLRAATRFVILRIPPARAVHSRRVCAVGLRLEQRLDAHGVRRIRNGDRAGAGVLAARP